MRKVYTGVKSAVNTIDPPRPPRREWRKRKARKMRKYKLTTKHKLLIMLIQPVRPMRSESDCYTHRDLQRGFKANWGMEISVRHLTRLISEFEKDEIIKRDLLAYRYGKHGNRTQANRYEIIDPEKGFKDLFDPR